MPLYEYRCASCGELMEALQRVGAAPLSECPRCGGALERIASAPALQFKGSGWYVNDYGRGRGNDSAGKAESGSSDKAKSSSPDKPERRSADKPESKAAEKPAATESTAKPK
jgi:putative FmdB family regulatory protein